MPEKRTYADRAMYLKKAVANRRRKLREMVIAYKGGKCVICGYHKYNGAFALHHIDGSKKEFGLSARGVTRSWNKVRREADKCVLVCTNCHQELHGGVTQLPGESPGRSRGELLETLPRKRRAISSQALILKKNLGRFRDYPSRE